MTSRTRFLVAIKRNSIACSIVPGASYTCTFDAAGRMYTAVLEGTHYRQGMDGNLYTFIRHRQPWYSRWQALSTVQKEAVYVKVLQLLSRFQIAVAGEDCNITSHFLDVADPNERQKILKHFAATWLDTIFNFHENSPDQNRYPSQEQQLAAGYDELSILPPDHYRYFVVRATHGCSYNSCLFCDLYKNVPFHIKSPEEFREHLEKLIKLWGPSLSFRRSIFLSDANALTIPHDHLMKIFGILNRAFDIHENAAGAVRMDIEHKKLIGSNGFDGIYAFLDVAGFAEKSIEQLIQLKQQGLRKVYIGMETGNPGLLKKIGKPFTIESLKRAAALLRDSGVAAGIIMLVGVGGEQWFDRHVNDSIAVVNELDLGKEDAIFLSRLIDAEDGRYGRWVKKAGIRPLDRNRMDEQFNRFLSGFSREDKNSPEVIYYNIEKFIF